jgi:hypothetical protein
MYGCNMAMKVYLHMRSLHKIKGKRERKGVKGEGERERGRESVCEREGEKELVREREGDM